MLYRLFNGFRIKRIRKGLEPGEGPNDFDETACHFFDNEDPVLSEHEKCGLTKRQYQILKAFRDKFRSFSDEHSYELSFIDTFEWNEITESSTEVLKSFEGLSHE